MESDACDYSHDFDRGLGFARPRKDEAPIETPAVYKL